MAPTSARACFASLPPELRIKVFRYIIPTGRFIKARVIVKGRRETSFPGRYLRVNKMFNIEAAQILYAENDFYCSNLYKGVIFMRRIGKNSSYVKTLTLGTFWLTSAESWKLGLKDLEHCSNRQRPSVARNMVVDDLARCTPSLTSLTLRCIGRGYHRSFLKMLESCSYLMKRMPMLPNVYYNPHHPRTYGNCYGHTLILDAEVMEGAVSQVSRPWNFAAANICRSCVTMRYSRLKS